MRQVEHGAGGPPEVLHLAEAPTPTLRPGEVLVEVHWAGVNRPDVLQRQGRYPPPPDASPVLGLEVAGRVVQAAPEVVFPRVGDHVCALTPGGGYAEYCAVPAAHCLPIPQGLSEREAAALPETVFTVWDNVFTRGGLQPGETLLVHGGSGGIGLTAVQLADVLGARVIATVGSDEKAAVCRAAGATFTIDYHTQDFAAEVARLTDGRGVDVILDVVGAPYFPRNLRALALDGRLVQIAVQQGTQAELDLGVLMRRRLVVTGSTLRPRTVAQKAAVAAAVHEHVWPLIARGRFRPLIHAEFPLAEAARAHALMEGGTHVGKIVLAVRPA